MLIDITRGEIKLSSLKKDNYYKNFVRKTPKSTYDAVMKRYHTFIDEQQPSETSQLTWFRLAKMYGKGSQTPHKDICYIEDVIEKIVGTGKEFLITAGVLMMVAVAEKEETYYSSKTNDVERLDPETGKPIEWRAYWRKEDKETVVNIDKLINKFNNNRLK